jgi:uncharacterized membrane protein
MNAKLFNASLLIACVLLARPIQASTSGYNVIVPATGGSVNAEIRAINDAGQLAGQTYFSGKATNAALWSSGGSPVLDLGTVSGASFSTAYSINDFGQTAGTSGFLTGGIASSWVATRWSVDLSNNVTVNNLGKLSDDSDSFAHGINNAGLVVGESGSDSSRIFQAILWDSSGGMHILDSWGGDNSSAKGINNFNQVVGASKDTLGLYHATQWNWNGSVATITDLGTPVGWVQSGAFAINDNAHVAGIVGDDSSEFPGAMFHATLWDGSGAHDLGALGQLSFANGINSSDQVVGWTDAAGDGNYHATLWDHGITIDLNSLLSSQIPTNWVLTEATGINDSGWITVIARNPAEGLLVNTITGLPMLDEFGNQRYVQHAFLLAPVPEPETYAMFMAGLGLMGFIARRRKNSQV